MKLIDIIANLDRLDDELIVFIEDISDEDSNVVLLDAGEDGDVVREHQGKTYEYLVEVIFAKKIIAEWKETLNHEPDVREMTAKVYEHATE